MRKCTVCGKLMRLNKVDKYDVVKKAVGLQTIVEADTLFEAFDCPRCGCQNLLNIRLPKRRNKNDSANCNYGGVC